MTDAIYWSTFESREVLPVLSELVAEWQATEDDTAEQDEAASRVFEFVCDVVDDADEDADNMAGARSNGFAAMANALDYWQSCVMARNFHKANSARALVVWEASQYVRRS